MSEWHFSRSENLSLKKSPQKAETHQRRHQARAEMSDVSEESLLDYFYYTGGGSGRVKNADMLKTYKPFIGHSDPQLRGK